MNTLVDVIGQLKRLIATAQIVKARIDANEDRIRELERQVSYLRANT